ncbi:efflux RND transporter permease subunit, partial [Algiphilus sp.]|uniref:EscS/YscS/HrcS family type III secretion system export apparatus protein n=1 Tax=Algiphilus sp. TaxID=1872431 RepID=UPI003C44B851
DPPLRRGRRLGETGRGPAPVLRGTLRMGLDAYVEQVVVFMAAVAVLAGIPLAVATLAGVVISFLQAITQIQDQTLPQTVKIVAIALTFIVGSMPLVFATGAGAASRQEIGTVVVGGMIAASSLALFFVPMVYRVLEELATRRSGGRRHA